MRDTVSTLPFQVPCKEKKERLIIIKPNLKVYNYENSLYNVNLFLYNTEQSL